MIDKKIFMLCESIREEDLNFLSGEYLANKKYDGERVISVILNKEVIMFNRRGKIVNFHFREIEQELKKVSNCIIDGEIISYNNKFEDLQKRALTQNKFKQEELLKKIPCCYMIFDILKYDNEDIRNKPLKERIEILKKIFKKSSILQVTEFNSIIDMLFKAKLENWEGIIIKEMNSKYESRRSKKWLKLKLWNETSLILTSYTPNNAGFRCEDNLKNAVQISGKQSFKVVNEIRNKGSCEVIIQYLTKTERGKFRFPSFRGLKNE
ncbi:MAG TPA: RNA ligase family protein [Candidatus Lokiarchaeia archaeon]